MRGSVLRCVILGSVLGSVLASGGLAAAQGADKAQASPAPELKALDPGILSAEAARQESLEGGLKRASVDLGQASVQYWTSKPAIETAAAYPLEKESLAIVDYAPTGELPIEMSRPTIYVMFNLPMVPLAKLGEPISSTPLMTISPPLRGVYRWYGTRVLSFQPEGGLVDQPRYLVTVSKDASSLGGRRLGKSFSFEFHTEPVKVVSFRAGKSATTAFGESEVPTAEARYLVLEFNQAVDPAFMKRFLSVKLDGLLGGRQLPFEVGRPDYPPELRSRRDRALLLTLSKEPPENAKLVLTLRDKAMPFEGYPTRSGDQVLSLKTVTPFRLSSVETYAYDMPMNNKPGAVPIYLRFTHDLARSLPAGAVSASVNGKEAMPTAVEAFGDTLRVGLLGTAPGDRVSIRASEAVKDAYGRPLSNAGAGLSVEIPRPEPIADFPDGFHHLEAQYPPRFLWAGRNLDSLALGREASDRFRFDLREREKAGLPALKSVDISGWKPNRVNYFVEDLKPTLNSRGFGTVYMSLRDAYTNDVGPDIERRAFAIQVTDLGITTRVAFNKVLVWVNSLSGGRPVEGAKVELGSGAGSPVLSGLTDSSGFASFPLASGQFAKLFAVDRRSYDLVVSASKDGDRADLKVEDSVDSYASTVLSHQTVTRAEDPLSRVLAFSDRGLYKPGEELALRGIHWIQSPEGFAPYSGAYTLELKDPRSGKLLWTTSASTSENGGFSARFKLPADVEPGEYFISYRHGGPPSPVTWYGEGEAATGVGFTVALFRKLAYQVKASAPERLYYVGDEASASVEGSYLAGGSMAGAAYSYSWSRKPAPFAPPGPRWRDYVFGPGNWEGERSLASGKGALSPAGQAQIPVSTADQNAIGSAYDYALEATVQDLDRQAIAAGAHILVHPASFYLGLRFSSGSTEGWWSRFVPTGQDVKVDVVAVDPRGEAWAKPASFTATIVKGDWKATEQQGVYGRINTRWEYTETKVSTQEVKATEGRASWSFAVKDSGDYLLVLEGRDQAGRLTKTVARFYATGSSWARRASETPADIQLIPDKELYLPGETARILVRSPIEKGDYLLTTEREGIYESRILHLEGGQAMLEVPVAEKYLPVFYVALTSFTKREAAPKDIEDPDLGRPRSLFGVLGLRVSTRPVELDVEVNPGQLSYLPGKEATVTVRVTREGKPVAGAEVTALAVDRGVLDLIDYHVPDPVRFFYAPSNFPLAVDGDDSRRLLMKPLAFDTSALTGGDGDKLPERSDYRPLALFDPFAKTDAEGLATMRFKLPDSLTTYRLTAFVVSGSRVGVKEGELLVQNPINVRAALPRRLRSRDTTAAGVVMKNLSSEPQRVEVTVESGILSIGGERTKSVEIPPNGGCELPFILSAVAPGEGKVTFTVRSAVVNERVSETVIVEQPLIKEAFSTVGAIPRSDNSATEGLMLPSAIAPGYGDLSFQAGSTLRTLVEPSLQRLLALPSPWWSHYDRILYSFAAVYAGEGKTRVEALAKELKARQQPDGGIYSGGYGRKPYVSDPYLSLLAAQLLEFAQARKQKLAEAPELGRLLSYAGGRSAKLKDFDPYFHAYANYVLAAGGKADRSYLSKVEALGDALGLGGYGLLAQAYLAAGDKGAAARVYKRCKNFVMMGTQSVDLKDSYEVASYWSSGIAELGILLKNARELGEDEGLVQRIAASAGRSSRHWRSYNDDLWTLLGFLPLLDAEAKGSGRAAVVLGAADRNLATLSLSPQAPASSKTLGFAENPLASLPKDKLLPVSIGKVGDAQIYYAMTLRYALPSETAFARDEGIEVAQRYETLDGDAVGEKDLKLGETYRVRVDVSSTKRRSRLELLAPIPSGLEIVDPTFVSSGKFAAKGGSSSETISRETVYGDTEEVVAEGYATWSEGDWELYYYRPDSFALDNMMVYRWADFYAGTRTVSFLARVTMPGVYPTPPAQASLELEPEVFGRSEGKLFVVKP